MTEATFPRSRRSAQGAFFRWGQHQLSQVPECIYPVSCKPIFYGNAKQIYWHMCFNPQTPLKFVLHMLWMPFSTKKLSRPMENDIGYRTIRYINQIFEKHFFKVWYSHKNWLSYCKDMITSHMWFKSTNAIKIRTTYVMNAILTKSKKPKVDVEIQLQTCFSLGKTGFKLVFPDKVF